jgi:hypothetical protein
VQIDVGKITQIRYHPPTENSVAILALLLDTGTVDFYGKIAETLLVQIGARGLTRLL